VSFLKRLIGMIAGPSLGAAAEKVRLIQQDMLGEEIKDFGLIESRKGLSGSDLEVSAALTSRQGERLLFLKLTERVTGSTFTRWYPVGADGRSALADALRGSDEEAFSPFPGKDTAAMGRWARFWKGFREGLCGEVLRDFGYVEDLEMAASSPDIPQWRWRQKLGILLCRKGGEDLLVLRLTCRGPARSGDIYCPFGEQGRRRLRQVLASQEA